ncbi:hypothetical protein ACLQ2R_17350 [Streptosporangium sp. DT93]|uniref:hypothetical protein n=1 Tax=Streptosporangium sp. DT93 TaxID=3393428 RepID=UPI003CE99AA9
MGPSLTIPWQSKEYLKAPIAGSADLGSLPPEMALLPVGQDPISGDWLSAQWIVEGGQLKAMILIGPDTALPLTKGLLYQVWVRITAEPEIPLLKPGTVYAS